MFSLTVTKSLADSGQRPLSPHPLSGTPRPVSAARYPRPGTCRTLLEARLRKSGCRLASVEGRADSRRHRGAPLAGEVRRPRQGKHCLPCIDGGGMHGSLPAAFLGEIEQLQKGGLPLSRCTSVCNDEACLRFG